MQIFACLPADQEEADPYGMHFTPSELPAADLADGVFVRVVAGENFGMHSPLREAANTHLYDITLAPNRRVEVPVPVTFRGFAMTVSGAGHIAPPLPAPSVRSAWPLSSKAKAPSNCAPANTAASSSSVSAAPCGPPPTSTAASASPTGPA